MSSFVATQGELYEIVKKRKLETIEESEEPDQTDAKEIDESLNELIIENEAEKFIELFEKTFSEETEEIYCKDGAIQDIISKVVLKIKKKIGSAEKNSIGLKLLRLLFVFVESLTKKDKSDGKNKSSTAVETCKHELRVKKSCCSERNCKRAKK